MTPLRTIVPLALVSFALLAETGGAAGETLKGVVGPGSTIALTKSDGSAVTRIDPGTYTFEIQDLADDHNFHLMGPGVDKATGVSQIVNTTWTVTLTSGTYTFLCDPHPSTMRGSFTVASSTSTAVKLTASVGPKASINLTKGGKKVTSLTAGTYQVTVKDRTTRGNFHLTGPGINRKTSVGGTSTTTWKLTLKPGTYTFRSGANAKLKRTFTVRAS